jgi:thioesterase domain-containing protein/acyl carrier protein
VRDCLVTVQEIVAGEKQLIAYVISENINGKVELSSGELNIVKDYLKTQLPHYQVPNYFICIDYIPVTANGKVNKKNLPLPVLASTTTTFVAPRNTTEIEIAEVLGQILGIKKFSINDRFFDLGGHSISAVRLISAINKRYGKKFPVSVLNEYDTVGLLSRLVSTGNEVKFSALVELSSNGTLVPFYCIHPIGGHVMSYQELAKHFFDRPFVGIQSPGIVDETDAFDTVEEMAAYYVALIKQRQPDGPYLIGGWSFGGILAYEVARIMENSGDSISGLVMIDSYLPVKTNATDDHDLFLNFVTDLNGRFNALNLSGSEFVLDSLNQNLKLLLIRMKEKEIIPMETDLNQLQVLYRVYKANMTAMNNYQVPKINTPAYLIKATDQKLDAFSKHPYASSKTLGWERYANVAAITIEGDHYSIFDKHNVVQLASLIRSTISDFSLNNC